MVAVVAPVVLLGHEPLVLLPDGGLLEGPRLLVHDCVEVGRRRRRWRRGKSRGLVVHLEQGQPGHLQGREWIGRGVDRRRSRGHNGEAAVGRRGRRGRVVAMVEADSASRRGLAAVAA